MTSEPERAFVWVWLPGATEPVVAGRLDPVGPIVNFTYGRSYLGARGRIPSTCPSCRSDRGDLAPRRGDRRAASPTRRPMPGASG